MFLRGEEEPLEEEFECTVGTATDQSPPPEDDMRWVPVVLLALILILALACCLLCTCCYDRAEQEPDGPSATPAKARKSAFGYHSNFPP